MISPKRIAFFVVLIDLVLFLAGYREITDNNGMALLGYLLMLPLPIDIIAYTFKFYKRKEEQ